MTTTVEHQPHDGVSEQEHPTAPGEERHEEGVGAARAGDLLPEETAREHLRNALQIINLGGVVINPDESPNVIGFENDTLLVVRSRIMRALEQVEGEAEILELRAEVKRLTAALQAPKPIGVTYIIDTHRGDSVVVANDDGSVFKRAFDMTPAGQEDRYVWSSIGPVPGTRAALLAAGGGA